MQRDVTIESEVGAILAAPYGREIIPDASGRFSAQIVEFPGCFAEGASAEEAFNNLEEAARSWVASELARGREVPRPTRERAASGVLSLRLPRSMHHQAAQLADRDGVSLNQFIVTALAEHLGARTVVDPVLERLEKLSALSLAGGTMRLFGTFEPNQQSIVEPALGLTTISDHSTGSRRVFMGSQISG
jgi:predicted RNase H-like HicB family nuclease